MSKGVCIEGRKFTITEKASVCHLLNNLLVNLLMQIKKLLQITLQLRKIMIPSKRNLKKS